MARDNGYLKAQRAYDAMTPDDDDDIEMCSRHKRPVDEDGYCAQCYIEIDRFEAEGDDDD